MERAEAALEDAELEVEYEDDDIDWDDIIATTQPDIEAGIYAFSTKDYATPEEGMAALRDFIYSIGNGDADDAAGRSDADTPRS